MTQRPWFAAARAAHAAAAPASTLLVITLVLLLLAGVARAVGGHDPAVHVSERASPERTIEVAVEAPADAAIHANLPGLDLRLRRLAFDPRTGYHFATLTLPDDAPTRGWCTVRITFADQRERDVRVELDPTPYPEI